MKPPRHPTTVLWVCAALLVAGAVAALVCLRDWRLSEFVAIFLMQVLVYGCAAWVVLNRGARSPSADGRMLAAILLVAGLLRAIALFAPQALSTDAFRYVWDGRVQSAAVNPYRYIPADPALAFLRDETIYPNINRADYAHTIYPPTAQLAFLAIERIDDSILGMKLGMLAFDGLSIGCLVALLRSRGLSTTRVLLYAWHPLPIWEFAGTGHVDAIAIALLLLAFLAAARRAPVWTGIALAAATLVKYYPVIAAPCLYRRWDWRLPAAFAATAVVLYLPYLGVGGDVFGFLGGYVKEEGLGSGNGVFLPSLLRSLFHVPAEVSRYFLPAAAGLMVALGVWTQFSPSERSRDALTGTLMLAGIFTLLVSPHDPWYFTWLVPFLCFRWSLAHLWLTAACIVMYLGNDPTALPIQSLIYAPFLFLLLVQWLVQRRSMSTERFDAHRAQRHSSA